MVKHGGWRSDRKASMYVSMEIANPNTGLHLALGVCHWGGGWLCPPILLLVGWSPPPCPCLDNGRQNQCGLMWPAGREAIKCAPTMRHLHVTSMYYVCTHSSLQIIVCVLSLPMFPVEMLPVSGNTSNAALSSTLRSEAPATATSIYRHVYTCIS